jgi:hypothetical protein
MIDRIKILICNLCKILGNMDKSVRNSDTTCVISVREYATCVIKVEEDIETEKCMSKNIDMVKCTVCENDKSMIRLNVRVANGMSEKCTEYVLNMIRI